MQHDAFTQFIEALLHEQGAATLPAPVVQEMRTELTERLQDFLMAKLVAQLNDTQRDALQDLLKKGAPNNDLALFFQHTLADRYTEIVTGILASFRALYIA